MQQLHVHQIYPAVCVPDTCSQALPVFLLVMLAWSLKHTMNKLVGNVMDVGCQTYCQIIMHTNCDKAGVTFGMHPYTESHSSAAATVLSHQLARGSHGCVMLIAETHCKPTAAKHHNNSWKGCSHNACHNQLGVSQSRPEVLNQLQHD